MSSSFTDVSPDIVCAYPTWVLKDENTGMKATGDTYLQARKKLLEFCERYSCYDEWLNEHGSLADRMSRRMNEALREFGRAFGGGY
jgi:hypothetical protein